MHGANRLGGNSLLDTIVFGKLGALAIDEFLSNNEAKTSEHPIELRQAEIEKKMERFAAGGTEKTFALHAELNRTMFANVGIFRQRAEMEQAVKDILELKERYKHVGISSADRHMNYELMNALELEYMLDVAHVIALGAFLREESRGAHFRRDFSTRNDAAFLKHTIARVGPDGEPVISDKPVVITSYQPMERTY